MKSVAEEEKDKKEEMDSETVQEETKAPEKAEEPAGNVEEAPMNMRENN